MTGIREKESGDWKGIICNTAGTHRNKTFVEIIPVVQIGKKADKGKCAPRDGESGHLFSGGCTPHAWGNGSAANATGSAE